VATGFFKAAQVPWVRTLAPVLNTLSRPFTVTPQVCAEYMWHGLFQSSADEPNLVGSKGQKLKWQSYDGEEEERAKLWEHTVEVTKTS